MNVEYHNQNDFDARQRQLHAHALTTLSADTRTRLRQSRHPADTRHFFPRWLLATGGPALLAAGIGVYLSQLAVTAPPSQQATASAIDFLLDAEDNLFEENPDLYVWLGSETPLTME